MENIQPRTVKNVSKELQEIQKNNLEGIELIINDQDVTDVQAIIDGPPGTPYENGQFRIKLSISSSYPKEPPKGYFYTKIFHPNIAPSTGEICLNTMKKDWQPDLGIKHLLLTIKCLLIVPNAESALNEEAGKLLLEHYDEYARRARLFTEIHARVFHRSVSCSSTSSSSATHCDSVSGRGGGASNILPGCSSTQQNILRDSNNELMCGDASASNSVTNPSTANSRNVTQKSNEAKKTVSANKKALKRL